MAEVRTNPIYFNVAGERAENEEGVHKKNILYFPSGEIKKEEYYNLNDDPIQPKT